MEKSLLRFGWLAALCLFVFATCAQGQDTATWLGGNGNYGNASQWICDGPDFPSGPKACVPNGGQFAASAGSGLINVDINVNVGGLAVSPNVSLSLNGTSLTSGSPIGTLASAQLTNGAVINTADLITTNLTLQNSTINGEAAVAGLGTATGTANIVGSKIQTLVLAGSGTLSNSSLGDNSVLEISGPSSVSNTSFNGLIGVELGGSLTIDNGSKINSVLFRAAQDVTIGGAGTGSLTLQGGAQLNVNGANLVLGGAANTIGTFDLNDSGSLLNANKEFVGSVGTGTFMQTGGTNTVKQLFLGDQPGSNGTYNLSGGTLSILGTIEVQNFTVGNNGTGVFNQSDGTVSLSNLTLYLGFGGSGNGSYFQTGGTNTVKNLNLASTQCVVPIPCSSGRATYSLGGSAVLTAVSESVGDNGTGVFNQDGGTNSVTTGLGLGEGGGRGTYNLNGGRLAVTNVEQLASSATGSGTGIFNQNGGTNIAGAIEVGTTTLLGSPPEGVYNLMGGTLSAGKIEIFDGGTFNYSGGTLTGNFVIGTSGTLIGSSGTLNVLGPGTRMVSGNLSILGGTVNVTSDKAQFFNVTLTSGVFKADPTAVEFQNLSVGAAGVVTGVAGDVFSITGNFQNLSTQNTLWDTSSSVLDFTGGGTHEFALAGKSGAGFSNNFAWGTLALDPGNTLDLVLGSGDALYAFILQGLIISGNTVTNVDGAPGLFLYYDAADNPFLNGNYNLTGGGELIAVNGTPPQTPEPSTWLLMASGLSLLVGRCGWRRTRNSPRAC